MFLLTPRKQMTTLYGRMHFRALLAFPKLTPRQRCNHGTNTELSARVLPTACPKPSSTSPGDALRERFPPCHPQDPTGAVGGVLVGTAEHGAHPSATRAVLEEPTNTKGELLSSPRQLQVPSPLFTLSFPIAAHARTDVP